MQTKSFKFKPIHLLALLIPIIILLASYNAIYHTTTLTPSQELITSYVNSPSQEEAQTLLDQEPLTITANELSHLDDVAKLMRLLNIILIASIIIVTIKIYKLHKNKDYKTIKQLIIIGSSITLILLLLFIIATQIDFTQSFQVFQKLLFPQGNYQFPESSYLITNLSAEFFQNLAIKIGITAAILSTITILTTILLPRKV